MAYDQTQLTNFSAGDTEGISHRLDLGPDCVREKPDEACEKNAKTGESRVVGKI